jgi:anti-sigma factor RsiW
MIEVLMDYLEGELPPAERELLDLHLAACPECVDYLASYEQTVRLGKVCCKSEEEEAEALPEELVQAILAARPRG